MQKNQKGVAAVEFALVLPLLLILTFITTEFGRALYQYNTLAKSVRDAARYMSIQDPSEAGKIGNARSLAVYGKFANAVVPGTDAPLALGLTEGMVKEPAWSSAGSNPVINTVTVTIAGCASTPPPDECYRFVPLINNLFGLNFGEIDYPDISATMRSAS